MLESRKNGYMLVSLSDLKSKEKQVPDFIQSSRIFYFEFRKYKKMNLLLDWISLLDLCSRMKTNTGFLRKF